MMLKLLNHSWGKMKLSEIISALQGKLQGSDTAFYSVSTDSRTCKSNALFFALHGPNFDGHEFIQQAKDKGAVAAVIDDTHKDISGRDDFPMIQVKDAHIALGQLARLYRDRFHGPVIAVTGSCGKTTTKSLITGIMSQVHSVLSPQGSFNNEIGLPLTLCRLTEDYDCVVLELGANQVGDIDYLANIARPTVAVITNAAAVHLEGLGNVAGVARVKGEIFNYLEEKDTAVINANDDFASYWTSINRKRQQVHFGRSILADVRAQGVYLDKAGYPHFTLVTPQGSCDIGLHLIGEHNVHNALAAAAAAVAVDVPLKAIKKGLEDTQPVEKRLIKKLTAGGVYILDDTYNANPMAMLMALKVLAQQEGESVFVMGDMAELGEEVDTYHRQIGRQAKEMGISQFYGCGEFTQLAVEAFGEAGKHFDSCEALAAELGKQLKAGMTVLVKGSRKAKMERVVEALMQGSV